MNRNDRFVQPNAEDIFATAASRLEAGESIPDILASYPPAMHQELLEMLKIVQVTMDVHAAPVPRPSQARRTQAKRAFLATAAQMRTEQLAQIAPPQQTVTRPASRSATRRAARRRMNPWERFTTGFQEMFSNRALGLAPIIVLLILVSTTTLVPLAQGALPGDAFYTLKQLSRKLELSLTPADLRDEIVQKQEQQLAEDVAEVASRADANSAIVKEEDTQIFRGRTGGLYKVGGLKVIDQYQPDANVETFEPMTVEGDLQPGSQVYLVYQIMPGQRDTVQGISLTVLAPPPAETEVIEVDVPTFTAKPEISECAATKPEGWVLYDVKSGDNLTHLASRGGTTIEKLVEVNCLDTQELIIDQQIYVPADSLKTDIPLLACGSTKPADWALYEIQAGENLTLLADRGNVSVEEIMAVNCMDDDTLVIGQKIYVPASATTE